MPIFEFFCDECGKTTEKIMRFEESEKKDIPCNCGTGTLSKIPISSFNFSLKGNWFKNNQNY